MLRDQNYSPLVALDSYDTVEAKPSAFAGGTADSRGNDGGANDPFTLFTVTGDVLVRLYGVCTVTLTGSTATLEVGTANNTAQLIAQTTATDIDEGDIWLSASPSAEIDSLSSLAGASIIAGADIVETVGTADVTGGNIRYVCIWRPISPDGNVVSAV